MWYVYFSLQEYKQISVFNLGNSLVYIDIDVVVSALLCEWSNEKARKLFFQSFHHWGWKISF